MTVSVLMPFTSGCEHRARAREFVLARYAREHPDWPVTEGACVDPWSKGAALADAYRRSTGDVLVIADADSFTDPATLIEAVRVVESGVAAWVVPHRKVYRLNPKFTAQVLAGGGHTAKRTIRHPYTGVKGGGITVLSRQAWETVGGVDPRFVDWGGEDIAFGWALETMCGPCVRLSGDLIHLWHPMEARGAKQRGSPASEALAGRYRDAHLNPRLMRAVIDGGEPPPRVMLDSPAVFRSRAPGLIVRHGRVVARFRSHRFETTDPDVAHMLRSHPRVEEVTPCDLTA